MVGSSNHTKAGVGLDDNYLFVLAIGIGVDGVKTSPAPARSSGLCFEIGQPAGTIADVSNARPS